jgi:hypothetical protein
MTARRRMLKLVIYLRNILEAECYITSISLCVNRQRVRLNYNDYSLFISSPGFQMIIHQSPTEDMEMFCLPKCVCELVLCYSNCSRRKGKRELSNANSSPDFANRRLFYSATIFPFSSFVPSYSVNAQTFPPISHSLSYR